MNSIAQSSAQAFAKKWHDPNPNVGGGHDSRSSENGLLSIFYGSLDKASQFDWLNAGRTLVDKTYINILWQAEQLSLQGKTPQDIASNLDRFIRDAITPIWDEIDEMDNEQLNTLSISLVKQCAEAVFCAEERQLEASVLLFYLCPQLPIFPVNAQIDTDKSITSDYADFHQAARSSFIRQLPNIYNEPPTASYGNEKEQRSINTIIKSSNWWQRRCFLWALALKG